MVQIVYLDIDGTLRDECLGVPTSARQALAQAQHRGVRVVVCTGRNLASVQDDVRALKPDGLICGGGCAMLYHGTVIKDEHLDSALLEALVKQAQRTQVAVSLETAWDVYMDARFAAFYRADALGRIGTASDADGARILAANKIVYHDNLSDAAGFADMVHKVCLLGSRAAIKTLADRFGGACATAQCRPWGAMWYWEVLPAGCDKGSAVYELNARLGIPDADSMAFGDGDNDVAMLKAAGIGIAMGNASRALKRMATSVCETVADDGIARELVRRGIVDTSVLPQAAAAG